MAEMKGIKLCGECGNYDYKKHRCRIGCMDDSNAQASFYGDCPLPDVVPKSEYDAVVSAVDNSTKEFLKLHDEYQDAKSEVEELKDWVEAYKNTIESMEKIDDGLRTEVADLQDALKCEKETNSHLCEQYMKAKQEVAREIFKEFERLMENNEVWFGQTDEMREEFAKLKKKYTEVDNAGK